MPIDRIIERFLRILFWRQVSRARTRGFGWFRYRRKPETPGPAPETGAPAAPAELHDEAAQDSRPDARRRAALRKARKATRLTRGIGRSRPMK